MSGNGNDSEKPAETLVGVSALAKALKKTKGTISKHAKAGKIPVARYDSNGAPLFDVAVVRDHYGDNLNELMRRTSEGLAPDDDLTADESTERRSTAPEPPKPSALQRAALVEKELKGRKLFADLVEREGLTVLKHQVDLEQTTLARRTRDAVTAFFADKASAAYAFAGQPRTEAEWRVWLSERSREAFNNFAATLALEDDDEFDDDVADNGGVEPADAPAVS